MRRPVKAILPLLLVFFATPCLSAHVIQQINNPACDCDNPGLAVSPNGHAMVVWVQDGCDMWDTELVFSQLIPSYAEVGQVLPEPVSHGPGNLVAVCWSREGYTLAMASSGFLVIYQSDLEGNFNTEEFDVITPYPDAFGIHTIDLWGPSSDAAGPHVFMAVGGTLFLPTTDRKVVYASRSSSGWSSFEVVAEGLPEPGFPQISYGYGPAGPVPTVYYLDGPPQEPSVVYTTKWVYSGWDEPTPVPGPVAGPFDVHRGGFDQRAVLGLGAQPTCPCGTIHHIGTEPGGDWLPSENLTVDHGLEYDWPMSPNVKIGRDGRVHAFWYQLGSGYMLDPKLNSLEYWVKDDGLWTEEGAFLDEAEVNGLGSRVAMALTPEDKPIFAWSRKDTIAGEPQHRAIWIARTLVVTDVPDGGKPELELALKAQPNPFNPRTTVSFSLDRPRAVTLAVYDLAGRRLVTLAERIYGPGSHTENWDGNDARGRALGSGTYFLRLETEGRVQVEKVQLVR